MRLRNLILALAACLGGAPALAADPVRQFDLDELIPLPSEGFAPVDLKVGPVSIVQVRIRQLPSPSDLRLHTSPSDRDRSHPDPEIDVRNESDRGLRIELFVSLQDEEGNEYLRCQRGEHMDAGEATDYEPCGRPSMYTRDWPKVKVLRLAARVLAPAPATQAASSDGEGNDLVVVHYHRRKADYSSRGLFAFDGKTKLPVPFVTWKDPLPPTGQDDFGAYWTLRGSSFRSGIAAVAAGTYGKSNDHPGTEDQGFGMEGVGAKSFALSRSREVWMNDDDPVLHFTKEDAVAAQPK